MRTKSLLLAGVVLALGAALFPPGSAGSDAKSTASAAARLVVKPAADLTWGDLDPKGAPGVKVATLWGDPAKGAFGAFFKLPAGFAVPLHTHTYDIRVVIVSGTYIQAPDGKPEFRIGPGSYFFQPGGNYRHTTSCDPASECLFFAESKGKFDLKVVAKPTPTAKK